LVKDDDTGAERHSTVPPLSNYAMKDSISQFDCENVDTSEESVIDDEIKT